MLNWLRDWGTFVSSVAAAVTAVVALCAIIITVRGRTAERRAELRRELLKWAIDTNVFAIENRTEAVEHFFADNTKCEEFIELHIYTLLFSQVEPTLSWALYAEHIAEPLGSEIRDGVIKLRLTL